MRIILTARGKRNLTSFFGFSEVLISHTRTPFTFLGYAAGFALGNLVGIYTEKRVVSHRVRYRSGHPLEKGRGTLRHTAQGRIWRYDFRWPESTGAGAAHSRRGAPQGPQRVVNIIRSTSPTSFFSVEDVRMAHAGVFLKGHRGNCLSSPRKHLRG